MFGYVKPVAPAFNVMALAGDELPLRLAGLLLESGLFAANPSKARNNGQTHRLFIVKAKRRGYPHTTTWGIDTYVEVLDVAVHDLDGLYRATSMRRPLCPQ